MAIMDTPKTLNGFPVVRVEQHKNCATVMVDKQNGEFVVATWWPELKSQWMWGHYTPFDRSVPGAEDEATRDARGKFNEVASRNTGR